MASTYWLGLPNQFSMAGVDDSTLTLRIKAVLTMFEARKPAFCEVI
jgi:hypothetical protein